MVELAIGLERTVPVLPLLVRPDEPAVSVRSFLADVRAECHANPRRLISRHRHDRRAAQNPRPAVGPAVEKHLTEDGDVSRRRERVLALLVLPRVDRDQWAQLPIPGSIRGALDDPGA